MKDIQFNEQQKENFFGVVTFYDHFDPDETHIYISRDFDKFQEFSEKINEVWVSKSLVDSECRVMLIEHDDETCLIYPYESAESFKQSCISNMRHSLEIWPGDYIEELYTGFASFNIDDADNTKMTREMSDDSLYQCYVEDYINNSYVDGDSNDILLLVDLKKREVLLGGSGDVMFHTDADINELFEDNED